MEARRSEKPRQDDTGPEAPGFKPVPLARWLWRAYLRSALFPILAIEIGFLATYWIGTLITYRTNIGVIRPAAEDDFARMAQREALAIDSRLASISELASLFAEQATRALAQPYEPAAGEMQRYAFSPERGYATQSSDADGAAAAFYASTTPLSAEQLETVKRSSQLDPLMRSIKQTDPLIAKLYLTTRDSYTRIFPYSESVQSFSPKADLTRSPYYLAADAERNPSHRAVWTAIHVDPVTDRWMMSSVAPLYRGNTLIGVVGIDIAVDALVQQVLDLHLPWNAYGVLLNRDGTVLAMPRAGEQAWGFGEADVLEHVDPRDGDADRPEQLNIHQRADTRGLAAAMASGGSGRLDNLRLGGELLHSTWAPIEGADWTLLLLASEDTIVEQAARLNHRLIVAGFGMVLATIVVFVVFTTWLGRRARALGRELGGALSRISQALIAIGRGQRLQAGHLRFDIRDLDRMGEQIVRVGEQLAETNEALVQAQHRLELALMEEQRLTASQRRFISAISHEFRNPLSIIDSTAQSLARRADRMSAESIAERSEELRTAVRRLSEVIDSASVFMSFEQQRNSSEMPECNLDELLQGVRHRLLRQHVDRTRDLRLDPAVIGTSVRCDQAMLRVIVSVLVDNALRHSAAGTEVRIRAEAAGRRLTISVSDRGPGMSEEMVSRALLRPLEHKGDTSGAGLRLARVFAEMYDGKLEIESKLGAGTEVRVVLPLNGATGTAEKEGA
ncbi:MULTISPECIES: sensor histidine kinase [Hydrocarboniphaga]|uniref:sensor histidine kinase n=1 Tax=Hydrocarboniphaga TaxID=243627 RepID=UPI002ABCA7D7|nr:sensor histidine kinase [Hydrocarboniphaga sp.]MDZ4079961.1 sensor histidine kinase [Hydrocarboniphaga sp.]